MPADTTSTASVGRIAPTVQLSCSGLWKVFGASPAEFERTDPDTLTDPELAQRGWVPAVRDVSFEVATGEVFVIMGLSGSGKSTLIRCLTRLVDPTAGSITIGGIDLLSAGSRALIDIRRQTMGMVFQNFALLPHRTVLGNIAFPLQTQGISRAAREARAREMVDVVGLTGREDHYPGELSGGQQQRVGIARSLVTDPPVWFLDEPFSALDPLIRADLQDELLRLQSRFSKTIIFITHDLDEAIKIADRIAIMESGRVVQIGTPEDLVLNPADDYVARFTAKVPLAKVVTVRSVTDFAGTPRSDPTIDPIDAQATLESVAARIVEGPDSQLVTDMDTGETGCLDKSRALRVIAGLPPTSLPSKS